MVELSADSGVGVAHYSIEGYVGALDAVLSWLEQQPIVDRRRAASAAKLLEVLRANARTYTVGQPQAWIQRGRLAWLKGRRVRARSAWRRGLRWADRLGMPYEQAQAHAWLGRGGSAGDRERALELFERLGPRFDLRLWQDG